MRINKYVAQATGMSRRKADSFISAGRVTLRGRTASLSDQAEPADDVTLDNKPLKLPAGHTTIIINKPVGVVCSREGQGSKTVYDILPGKFSSLKPVGRLDKDSSGLLLLTDDGTLANELTHPKYAKLKTYMVRLDKGLEPLHRQMIQDNGIMLIDGVSKFSIERTLDGNETEWVIRMTEGRNRQIRRTFAALGYTVTALHRTSFGSYAIDAVPIGDFRLITSD